MSGLAVAGNQKVNMQQEQVFNTDPIYITRFLAALCIVVHHFWPPSLIPGEWAENLIFNVNEGVNYFFFLSGFVMVIAYRKDLAKGTAHFSKWNYWVKRFSRIYPVYMLALFGVLAYHFLIEPYFSHVGLRFPFEAAMLQTWIGQGSLNSPAWSVSCEIFFYVCFPFFAPALYSFGGKKIMKKLVLLFIFIIILTLFGNYALTYNETNQGPYHGFLFGMLTYHPLFRFTTFFAGTLCAVWFLKNADILKRLQPYSPFIMTLSAMGIFVFLTLLPMEQNMVLNYGLLIPFYFLFVISICNMKGWLDKALSKKWCIFLGDISYGLYILQVPVQMFFIKYIMPTKTPMGFAIYLIVLLVVSGLSYFYLEKILRNKWNKKLLVRTSELRI